jgi:uncharacterized protein (DUF1810 family)
MAGLQEFVDAQDKHWPQILGELRDGRKATHWIWYVFPQLATLGRSAMARQFGLSGIEEAGAYLAHPVLGPRLIETTALLMAHQGLDPVEILGPVDALKVRSCLTLFEAVPDAPELFSEALNSLYSGERCPATQASP